MLSARPLALNASLRDRTLLQENLHRVPLTVNAKAKTVQTPRRPLTIQSHKILSRSAKPSIRVQKPLGDKTPFPNRVANAVPFDTPAPQTAKLAKLALLEAPQQTLPESFLRPSSARKSLRAPRASVGAQHLDFKTPVTLGNHWDVSDGEIEVEADEDVLEVADVRGEDDEEIEYMPPTAIVPAYEPPFEMPDYKQLGATMRGLAHSYKFDDTDDLYHALNDNVDIGSQELWRGSGFASVESPSHWETPELPTLENELFVERRIEPKPSRPQGRDPTTIQHKHTSSLPTIRSTSTMRSTPSINTKPPTRPGQSASRAPSRPTSATTTTASTSSRSAAGPSTGASSNKPSANARAPPVRPRSQTTSQIARPVSATATRHDPNAHMRSVASKEATSIAARPKATNSVYATTAGLSRTASSATAASKQTSARLGLAATSAKTIAAASRPITRPVPSSARTTASTTQVTVAPTMVRAGSAPGKRPVAMSTGTKPKASVPDAGDLLQFDDPLASDEDFVFEFDICTDS
ncbi:uncharacterized protein B0H18DRAFT_986323 [Fomitopsis serialis]|uniref:uncharacterized protein n=1 Tax=Fomitopsis serialis TaxID=139415 RepID=UPI0020088D4C|nr:uncharacterized protein B0H18DRAFT_986323 [Neoantrodia serialis]KAH9932577.1 hypothetical protein B0H18DRAFT_986323 [Neoantrodia serialis]